MHINLLITGGLGYIGSFTAKYFLSTRKRKSYVIDNLSRGNIFSKKYSKFRKLNINQNSVIKFINNNKINTVLHLASYTCVRESVNKSRLYYQNNYKSQIKFLKNILKTNVKFLIFSSTLSIYDNSKVKKDPSPYSNYKRKVEKFLKKISSKNLKVIILRYPNVIGADKKGTLGEKNRFIKRIVPTFYKNITKKKINILYYDFKKKKYPLRGYMHVYDIAKLNLKVLNNFNLYKKNFYAFNVTTKKYYSNIEVAKSMANILKTKIKIKKVQINRKESLIPKYDLSKSIFRFMKFKTKYNSLKTMLITNIKWFKKIY